VREQKEDDSEYLHSKSTIASRRALTETYAVAACCTNGGELAGKEVLGG